MAFIIHWVRTTAIVLNLKYTARCLNMSVFRVGCMPWLFIWVFSTVGLNGVTVFN